MERRLDRIETKLDKLAEGFLTLARLDERMITLFRKADGSDAKALEFEQRLAAMEKTIHGRGLFFRWLDRGAMAMVGAAAVVVMRWIERGGDTP